MDWCIYLTAHRCRSGYQRSQSRAQTLSCTSLLNIHDQSCASSHTPHYTYIETDQESVQWCVTIISPTYQQDNREHSGQRYLNGDVPQLSHTPAQSSILNVDHLYQILGLVWKCCACAQFPAAASHVRESETMSVSSSSSSSSDGLIGRERRSKINTHLSIGEDGFQREEELLR